MISYLASTTGSKSPLASRTQTRASRFKGRGNACGIFIAISLAKHRGNLWFIAVKTAAPELSVFPFCIY
ncbi:MAG: hypothetical protein CSA33_04975 [Desulfobulbus propionicus]|nr:MAG: hypothetical protein CSA33_04975 [Desulfobulbus propionicus]